METLAIFGPPGTGKTHELIGIAEQEAMHHPRVLFLSYTRAAAEEATSRIAHIANRVTASTIHAACFNAMGGGRNQVVDAFKLVDFTNTTGFRFKRGYGDLEEGDEFLSVLSYMNNTGSTLGHAWEMQGCPGNMAKLETFDIAYREWKKAYGFIDFDDMLLAVADRKVKPRPETVVILDEAQDCSPLQWRVFSAITEHASRVYVAGDDDQAIYEWSGADPHGMVKFADTTDGEQQVLAKSHRITDKAHKYVHDRVVPKIEHRVQKQFAPKGEPGILQNCAELFDLPRLDMHSKSVLVLCRDNYRLAEYEKEMKKSLTPYRLSGNKMSPWTSAAAKALRGYMTFKVAGEEPSATDREAMLVACYPTARSMVEAHDWRGLLKMPWQQVVDVPPRLRGFYDHVVSSDPEQLFRKINIELSTIHAAKGREAEVVVCDMTMSQRVREGVDVNPSAEARVWYVGLTRSQSELYICGENDLI